MIFVAVMSQTDKQSLKQSARVQEKFNAVANVSTESIDVQDQWVYIFYFDCDDTYVRIEVKSPRWPENMKISKKNSVYLRVILLKLSVGNAGKRKNKESSNGKAPGKRVREYLGKCAK